ncbi:hypothetical protein QR680_014375 [Steinernema hermaphroditum]|uniref:Uncharacterized protein n=1 Tax=Steinernema hermaphroditum TaxID=289476 RepID=A0AA39IAU4_9BILA|nr:hypothetical protein QR680_014375 [Steinernema hermaphroditum]
MTLLGTLYTEYCALSSFKLDDYPSRPSVTTCLDFTVLQRDGDTVAHRSSDYQTAQLNQDRVQSGVSRENCRKLFESKIFARPRGLSTKELLLSGVDQGLLHRMDVRFVCGVNALYDISMAGSPGTDLALYAEKISYGGLEYIMITTMGTVFEPPDPEEEELKNAFERFMFSEDSLPFHGVYAMPENVTLSKMTFGNIDVLVKYGFNGMHKGSKVKIQFVNGDDKQHQVRKMSTIARKAYFANMDQLLVASSSFAKFYERCFEDRPRELKTELYNVKGLVEEDRFLQQDLLLINAFFKKLRKIFDSNRYATGVYCTKERAHGPETSKPIRFELVV